MKRSGVCYRRRKAGICWSCASSAPVRLRTFWTTGIRKPLCKGCERQFALCSEPKTEAAADRLRDLEKSRLPAGEQLRLTAKGGA